MDVYQYKDPRPLALAVCALAAFGALLRATHLVVDAYLNVLIHGVLTGEPDAAAQFHQHVHGIATVERMLVIGVALVWLAALIVFCFWLYQAAANIRALGARTLEFTPGWSVGYLFIPFANLVMGYRVMAEVWLTSRDPSRRTVRGGSALVLSWWILYLLAGLIGRIASIMIKNSDHHLRAVYHGGLVNMAAMLLFVVTAGLFMHIVWRSSRLQAACHGQPVSETEAAALSTQPT